MPSIPDEYVPLRATAPQEDQLDGGAAGLLDTVKSAGIEYNWPYRAYRYLENRDQVTSDPDHNPFDMIQGTKYASQPERFAFSRNKDETTAIMREWDADDDAKSTLAKSGWSGTVAGIGMGLLDPTIFVPVAKVFSGAAEGFNALRIGADVAMAGAASSAIGEGAMMATKPEYTLGDAALGVGTATVLSGLLGAGAGALLSGAERKSLETSFQADREAWGGDVARASGDPQPISNLEPPVPDGMVRVYHSGSVGEGETGRWVSSNRTYASDYRSDLPLHYLDLPESDPRLNNPDIAEQGVKQGFTFNFETTPEEAASLREISRDEPIIDSAGSSGRFQSAGAAASETRQLELNSMPGLSKLPDITAKMSPPRRVLNSGFLSARRAVADLVETPYIFKDNVQGIATTQGPALDRMAKLETGKSRIALAKNFDQLYTQYRFGPEGAGRLQKMTQNVKDLAGVARDKATYPEFKEMVDDALRNGDRHEIPEVEQAARYMRENVLSPWRDRAIAAGLLPEDVDVKTADSYMMRVWNKQKLIGERPTVVKTFTNWLESEQTKKAQARDRITGMQDMLGKYSETIDKLQSGITARVDALTVAEAQRAEVSKLNQAAFERAHTLAAKLDELSSSHAQNAVARGDIAAKIKAHDERAAKVAAIEQELEKLLSDLGLTEARRSEVSSVSKAAIQRSGDLRDRVESLQDQQVLHGSDTDEAIAATKQNAAGGSVFETKARNRQNVLADRISGARGKLDDTMTRLERVEKQQNEIADAIKGDIAQHPGSSRLPGGLTLQQQLDALEADEASARTAVANNMRGGSVFETRARNRQNVLAERIRGVDAQVDDLTKKLAEATSRHDALRADIEKEILSWEGKSSKEAKSALKARTAAETERQAAIDADTYKGAGGRLTAADSAVDNAIRRILAGSQDKTRQELESLANEIVERIVSGPDGRLPYDAPTGGPRGGVPGANVDARGPLASRSFMIPDNMVRDWLETDAQHVAETYLNTIVPDVLLTERFGDTDMTDVFRRLNEEAGRMEMAAKTDAERTAIRKKKNSVEADLAAMRDRIRHTYGFSSDPRQRFMGRVAATAARYDIITNLGGAGLSSLSDLAGIQWRYGMASTFKNAWAPMLKAFTDPETRKALSQYHQQLQAMGVAAETYLATRTHSLFDVLDVYKPTSRFERGMNMMADKFGLASLLTPWTDFGKFSAGMVSGSELTRAAEALTKGTATPRQIRDLAEGGIDGPMAERIWGELSAQGGSNKVGGIRIPNTGAWKDAEARNAFEGALSRDVDIMILTPGAEKPLMMSDPVKALIFQYKTFVAAANERILVRSLQARDAQVLQGMASAIALGALAEYAYTFAAGRDGPKTPQDWVKAGVERSGILGWYQEGNSVAAKWTGGTADAFRLIGAGQPDARFISRSPAAALLGPTFGKAESVVKTSSKVIAKMLGGDVDWNAADTTSMRRLLAGQNLFYIRRLLDAGEDKVDGALGVDPPNRR